MPSNNFLTTDLISNVMLAEFVNTTPFLHTASRGLESDFHMAGYKIGDSVTIRKQNHFNVGDGQIASVQAMDDAGELLTINHQYHVAMEYTQRDLTLDIDDFKPRYIDPAIQHIKNKMEYDIAILATQQLNFYEGTAGTPINSFGAVDAAGAKLLEMGVDLTDDAYCALRVRDGAALKNSLANFFNPTLNENITQRSALGRLSYFDMFQSQNIASQVAGNFGAGPITTTAVVSSGSSIPMTGLTPTDIVFKQGDIFEVVGVYSLNPLNFQSTGKNMQFVVTADVLSDGAGAASVPVAPAIISDPGNARRNVSQAIPNGATVLPVGNHNVNVAYASRGLDIVIPPIEALDVPFTSVVTDKKANVSMRISKSGDVLNSKNILRIDVLAGYRWHPEYAVRLIS